ncbi:hypothetical protein Q4530_04985 [Colwellia sp. 1_MG-2023]|uniref:hypothetical protein n=1 Tax=unclassified Colwellia TaxID=196834 RepID=UPI001C09EC78|nr:MULTISPECIES: hypothetical protein [unclassified Colwellia]MBU2924171.1 hypothetical protein [Colwellia sp. C2M11]MDO6486876.1 hypothetical protein [Colwellia sp. 6_MG-2023]MDO6652061.1 hypothetical protein [Colwellia sp. 3_MG-2023]MDO6664837.1 hypothetical protein [Colwellia sp. 2_MG-2023]MDO6689121.1 hypothetical protein [Colwellia sp. 1_MG-2023]
MKYELSFCSINILNENIAEVIVNKSVEISIEMVEEYDEFLSTHFSSNFGLLINKINHYDYSFEAKLSIASHENLKVIAVINYSDESEALTQKMNDLRAVDRWNLKNFSGINLGWQDGFDWLTKELSMIS